MSKTKFKKLPEDVMFNGFKDILESFDINLDDYNMRKLMYTIFVGVGFFFFHYPETFIKLEGMDIYRSSKRRNVLTLDISEDTYYNKDINVQGLYDYFIGGTMDSKELRKELEQYALSFIDSTYEISKKHRKAQKAWNRYKLLQQDLEDAKKVLKVLGVPTNNKFLKEASALARKFNKDRKDAFREHKNKNT